MLLVRWWGGDFESCGDEEFRMSAGGVVVVGDSVHVPLLLEDATGVYRGSSEIENDLTDLLDVPSRTNPD